ncbi:hypothetical protein V5O48_001541 [Marasmius crinis-equi]|uniref:Malate dehydrogenase n=1 Tax=Marasmius crinis-equi TaxID=585013 RepID=A0ABR3FY65_9AGAR
MFSFSKALLPLTFALSVLATCPLSDVKVVGNSLPPQESATLFLTLGVGTQNYTCSDAGNYTAAGAVAVIFDISCDYKDKIHELPKLATDAFDTWNNFQGSEGKVHSIKGGTVRLASRTAFFGADGEVCSALKKDFSSVTNSILGEHFFIPNPTGSPGTSPRWDFTQSQNNPNAFVTVARKASIAAPTGKQDIDWLDLTNIEGELAFEVYRTDTRSGQPPAKCEPGSAPIAVKYSSIYWFTQNKSK